MVLYATHLIWTEYQKTLVDETTIEMFILCVEPDVIFCVIVVLVHGIVMLSLIGCSKSWLWTANIYWNDLTKLRKWRPRHLKRNFIRVSFYTNHVSTHKIRGVLSKRISSGQLDLEHVLIPRSCAAAIPIGRLCARATSKLHRIESRNSHGDSPHPCQITTV